MSQIPEVGGGFVGHVEGFAVYLLMIQRTRAPTVIKSGMGFQERFGGDGEAKRHVPHVGAVEEVVARAELEVQLPVWSEGGGGEEAVRDAAAVFFADDAGGTDGAGEHVVVFAVGEEDDFFSFDL